MEPYNNINYNGAPNTGIDVSGASYKDLDINGAPITIVITIKPL